MALTTNDFTTTFNYTLTPKRFKFEDTTDYVGQGAVAANFEGVLKVVAPTGLTIYNNTNWAAPDILPGTSVFNTTTIPLPLDGSGNVLQGSYTFTYTVSNDNGVTPITKEYTYTFAYTSPSISVTTAIDYNAPLISGTDATNYTVNLITPTIVRDFTMAYPASVNVAAITGTNNVLSTGTFYVQADTSLQYTFTLISTLSYDFTGGLFVDDEITGTKRIDAYADADLCQLYCGLRSAYNRWQATKGTSQGQTYLNTFNNLMAVAALLQVAYNCGEGDDASGYVAVMKSLANFDECECSDSTPVLVTGLGGGGTIVVAAGSGIAVAVAAGGSSTTYTVSIDPATLALINSITHTTVTVGQGLDVASSTVGTTTNYHITTTIREVQELVEFVTIDFSQGILPVVSYGANKVYGGLLQAATVTNVNNGSVANWSSLNNQFRVSGFFTGIDYDYYPRVTMVESSVFGSTKTKPNQSRAYDLEVIEVDTNTFDIRVKSSTGAPLTGNNVDKAYTQIVFLINITV